MAPIEKDIPGNALLCSTTASRAPSRGLSRYSPGCARRATPPPAFPVRRLATRHAVSSSKLFPERGQHGPTACYAERRACLEPTTAFGHVSGLGPRDPRLGGGFR